ncbi:MULTISPECIES: tRNA (adenosine(37)-N6)-threonylcarbamoyltransferase complex ATPase subunit type 1 TsaE [Eikenella]|uniref:tRNA threonylcarbamoyladenosine biosynthesis protein TsaE n=1 Tax=Eikenella longinqua TaxID=1795827 RepID=A0A1A9S1Z8_9NEIS|nr:MULTISPECIES: tRNA (adenosine(37)-N6)-threonylcarbamoyltransferase complex ATPase subunit type 1 TsaE [Eikenella]OAM30852.1 tRNA (N6-adenosine(37)-N6)-threonylcarbamoyltransferase complex ATPase TsaE [Eikenella longinqua]
MDKLSLFLNGESATEALAARIAPDLAAPLVLWLEGDLGAGKTTLVRAVLRRLGHTGAVKSPTYAIVESYEPGGLAVHHFDLYRFASPEEWEDAGLDDLFAAPAVHFIEWPQRAAGFVPEADLSIALQMQGGGRICTLSAASEKGKQLLALWQNLPAELS